MNTEYEVRILNINPVELKEKLAKLEAKLEWEHLQRRYVYDFIPKAQSKWIRLRTNGKKSTLTIKNILSSEIDGTKELEITIDDFDKCNLILKEFGYEPKAYQENKRCQYTLNGVEIDIDSWPLIPPFLEIEGKSEKEVYDTLVKLGYTKENITTKNIESIFLDYGYRLDDIKELKLEEEKR